jgi:hypothetical protein
MKIVAVLVLDSRDVAWAARRATGLYHQWARVQIRLINLQPAFSIHISRFFSARYLERIHREEGLKLLAPVARALDKASVPHRLHVLVGRRAERIAEFVESYACSELLLRNESQSLLRLGFDSINSGIRRRLRALYPGGKISRAPR